MKRINDYPPGWSSEITRSLTPEDFPPIEPRKEPEYKSPSIIGMAAVYYIAIPILGYGLFGIYKLIRLILGYGD